MTQDWGQKPLGEGQRQLLRIPGRRHGTEWRGGNPPGQDRAVPMHRGRDTPPPEVRGGAAPGPGQGQRAGIPLSWGRDNPLGYLQVRAGVLISGVQRLRGSPQSRLGLGEEESPGSGQGWPLGSLKFKPRSRIIPFLWRWARPREVSSPLVRARSGWLLLAASLLVSSPRRLSEPQVCRAQGAASHSPRAGQYDRRSLPSTSVEPGQVIEASRLTPVIQTQ